MAQATYVTKYTAGGSGDNIIPDGYVKTVEKIWMDTYTIAFTNTNTTIDIAVLQKNKKVTSAQILIYTSVSQTSGTVSIGFSTDASVDTLLAATTITHNLTRTDIVLPAPGVIQLTQGATATSTTLAVMGYSVLAGFQKVTGGTQTTISVKLNNWTMTTGTVMSIVRYV